VRFLRSFFYILFIFTHPLNDVAADQSVGCVQRNAKQIEDIIDLCCNNIEECHVLLKKEYITNNSPEKFKSIIEKNKKELYNLFDQISKLTTNINTNVNLITILITVLAILISVFTIVISVISLGLFKKIKKTIQSAVEDRIEAAVRGEIAETVSNELEHVIHLKTAVDNAQASLAQTRLAIARENLRLLGAEIGVAEADRLEEFLQQIGDMVNLPARLSQDINFLTSNEADAARLRERVRALWSEVKAGTAAPRQMRRVVEALIQIIEYRDPQAGSLPPLRLFSHQLHELILNRTELPDEPGF